MALHSQYVLPQRSTAFVAVVCLHIGVVYLLATGLARQAIQLLPDPGVIFVDHPPRTPASPPPPPPRPQLDQVRPEIPVVRDLTIDDAPESATSPVATTTESPSNPQPVPPVVRVSGGVGKGFPNTDDFYPPSAIRLAQEGTVAVQVCVDERGRLVSEPTLAHSSSIASIDGAALRLARAGSGHYQPATENGRPVSSCYPFSVRFHLK